MVCTFTFRGELRGQGRPRFTKNGHAYESGPDRAYKKLIALEYGLQCGFSFGNEPVRVVIDVMRALPASQIKRGIVKSIDKIKPDCDNIAKAVLDALNGVAYDDDSQVVELIVRKFPRVVLPENKDVMRVTISNVSGFMIYPYVYADEQKGACDASI